MSYCAQTPRKAAPVIAAADGKLLVPKKKGRHPLRDLQLSDSDKIAAKAEHGLNSKTQEARAP
jgi:hypothetical protein